jgi:hypothetical protein
MSHDSRGRRKVLSYRQQAAFAATVFPEYSHEAISVALCWLASWGPKASCGAAHSCSPLQSCGGAGSNERNANARVGPKHGNLQIALHRARPDCNDSSIFEGLNAIRAQDTFLLTSSIANLALYYAFFRGPSHG